MKDAKNILVDLLENVPVLNYTEFYKQIITFFEDEGVHLINYFAIPIQSEFKLVAIIGNAKNNEIYILCHLVNSPSKQLNSLTEKIPAFQIFEREIFENFGIVFLNHPWLKPVRFSEDRFNKKLEIKDYPFYQINGNELHEVSVGPIHAGIIEPGHFRFLCHGEMVKHLEIQLGWQHRGIEKLFLKQKSLFQKNILAENIVGDSVIGHTMAFVKNIEVLANYKVNASLEIERAIALELERIAIHTGDLSAMCTDVAYQLGSNVFGALRTPIINYIQKWCGSRFGKGLIRIGGTNYPLTNDLKNELFSIFSKFESRFIEMGDHLFNLPSVIKRFDGIGAVSKQKLKMMGAVGMVAKAGGILSDTRINYPNKIYEQLSIEVPLFDSGDVMSRALVRYQEVLNSLKIVKELLQLHQKHEKESFTKPVYEIKLRKNMISTVLVEGWRGEIAHTMITDETGNINQVKIKDPSFHNWKALELSLRNLEISDFPINNKSYDLSYCGHDL